MTPLETRGFQQNSDSDDFPKEEVDIGFASELDSNGSSRLQRVAHTMLHFFSQLQHEVPSDRFKPTPAEYHEADPYPRSWLRMP